MRLAVFALLGGLAVAVALGGRLSRLPNEPLRWPGLTVLAMGLYWAPSLLGASASAAVAMLLCSYAALLGFALANLRVRGMAVVGLGLALNAMVISANGAMPVDLRAVAAAGLAPPGEEAGIDLGVARTSQEPGDRLSVLGDTVAVAVLDEVVSFGDLILAAGLANVAFRLLLPTAKRGPSERGGRPRTRAGLTMGPWATAR